MNKSKKQSGFSLLEMIMITGAIAGIAMIVMQLTKNTATTQGDAFSIADYISLRSEVDNLFNNGYDCTASFKDLDFKGSTIGKEPIEVELWHGDQDNKKLRKFLSSADNKFNKYGKLNIASISMTMPDYSKTEDFPQGTDEVFKAEISVELEKNKTTKSKTYSAIKRSITIVFDTDGSGKSVIKSCMGMASMRATMDTPPTMGTAKYCILANACPTGWIDNGKVGILANATDGSLSKCGNIFEAGADFNGTYGWCHPRICCNQ